MIILEPLVQSKKPADPILIISGEDIHDDVSYKDDQFSDKITNKESEVDINPTSAKDSTHFNHENQSGTPKVSFIKANDENVEDYYPNTNHNPIDEDSPTQGNRFILKFYSCQVSGIQTEFIKNGES